MSDFPINNRATRRVKILQEISLAVLDQRLIVIELIVPLIVCRVCIALQSLYVAAFYFCPSAGAVSYESCRILTKTTDSGATTQPGIIPKSIYRIYRYVTKFNTIQ